jgi:hypothetical protein
MHGSLAYKSSSAKLQNPEESQHLDDEFLNREKQANVLHLRRQGSFTFLFPARSRSVCVSLSPARALSPALSLSLSLGALSCSLVLSADLRFSAEHPRSYQPSWKSYVPPLVCLIYLITTLDPSAIYPLLLLYLFQRFFYWHQISPTWEKNLRLRLIQWLFFFLNVFFWKRIAKKVRVLDWVRQI